MDLKNFIRSKAEQFFTWGTNRSTSEYSVCFHLLNRNLCSLIPTVTKQRKARLVFLPKVKDVYFDWLNVHAELDAQRMNKYITSAIDFFKKNKVKYFVLDTLTNEDLYLHSAVLAAKLEGIKIVYLNHGECGNLNVSVDVLWLSTASYFYACNTMSKKYLQSLYREGLSEVREWRRPIPKRNKKVDDKLLLFAPAFLCGDKEDYFGSGYSDPMKYRVRKAFLYMLEDLAWKHDLKVVWKYVDYDGYDAVPDLIKKYDLKRIKYVTKPGFDYWVKRCGMFVSDCVSTTLIDALDMGVPSIGFWNQRFFPMKEPVAKELGNCIYLYNDLYEIEGKLEHFVTNLGDFVKKIGHNPDLMPWEN